VIRLALLGLLVAGSVGWLVYSASAGSTQYYRTVAELRKDPTLGDSRVLGTVEDDIVRIDGGLGVRFTAAQGGATLPVEYVGQLPDIFRPGIQVVVEGRLQQDGVFHARTLLAKCPSRFTAAPKPSSG
jgi:cytochrome c-type biogenesis protein CcmE